MWAAVVVVAHQSGCAADGLSSLLLRCAPCIVRQCSRSVSYGEKQQCHIGPAAAAVSTLRLVGHQQSLSRAVSLVKCCSLPTRLPYRTLPVQCVGPGEYGTDHLNVRYSPTLP